MKIGIAKFYNKEDRRDFKIGNIPNEAQWRMVCIFLLLSMTILGHLFRIRLRLVIALLQMRVHFKKQLIKIGKNGKVWLTLWQMSLMI